jgi:creatinine amidohydrolase/Fe(II)-dependent formamide hydrolase-like protein
MVQQAEHSLLLDELSTVQVRDLLSSGWDTVIVPLGATEQHGPALPLLVDNEHGVQTALRAARTLGNTLVGPVVTLGYSPEHAGFAGTVSLSKSTLAGMLRDIAESHARSGFHVVYFWIAHGGNNAVLQEVLPSLEWKWPGCYVTGLRDLAGYVANTWDRVPLEKGISLSISGSHAGEFETSMMLAARPDLVRMQSAEAGNSAPFETIASAMMRDGIDSVSKNGVLGDQRPANAKRGEFYLDTLAAYLVADLEQARRRAEKARAS